MIRVTLVLAAAAAAAAPAFAEERRGLGAHVHGEGALSIAVEGRAVAVALEAPGFDIVGFEHPAVSAEDRTAIAAAKAKLADPTALFAMGAAAECVVRAASVRLLGDDGHEHGHDDHGHDAAAEGHDDHGHDDHDHEVAADAHDDHGHDDHAHGEAAHAHEDHDHGADEATHTEFHAEYTLDCAHPERIQTVAFPYFDAFPNAEALDVTLASARGQRALRVTKADPLLDLAGSI